MKRILLPLIVALLLSVAPAFAQNFDFPSAPTLNQQVTGPEGQTLQWDGTKWIALGIGVGSGFAPLINPAGGQNNYAPIASPTFTGTVTLPDGATDTSGIGLIGVSHLGVTGSSSFTGLATFSSVIQANGGLTVSSGANLAVLSPSQMVTPDGGSWSSAGIDANVIKANSTLDVSNASAAVKFPDGATYNIVGLNNNKAIGIGSAVIAGELIEARNDANANAEVRIENQGTGTTAAAQLALVNGSGGTQHPFYVGLMGQSNTANPNIPADSAYLYQGGNGGLILMNNGTGLMKFWQGTAGNVAQFSATSPTFTIYNNASTGLKVGDAAIASVGQGNVNIVAGASYTGTGWYANQASDLGPFSLINQVNQPGNGSIGFYSAPAVPDIGTSIAWTLQASVDSSGLHFRGNSGTWTPTGGCSTTNPTLGGFGSTGYWVTNGNMLYYTAYVGWSSQTGGAGSASVNGLPYPAIEYTGAGYRGDIVDSNSTPSNAGSTRILATVFNGNSYVQLNETNFGTFGYIVPLPCANAFANQPSGIYLNGYYRFQ